MNHRDHPKFSPARRAAIALLLAAFVGCVIYIVYQLKNPPLSEAQARTDWAECQRTDEQALCHRVAVDILVNADDPAWLWEALSRLIAQCEGGYADSCQALVVVWRNDVRDEDRYETSHLAPCSEGATLDCALRASAAGRAKEECENGNSWACIVDSPAPIRHRKNAPALCSDGFQQYCSQDDAPYDIVRDNAANTMYAAYTTTDDAVLREACDADQAEACFALGLNLTRASKPHSEPIPTKTLDDTLGRACELRYDHACVVYASRLLDRPFPTGEASGEATRVAPDTAKIAALLKPACERGDAHACWLIAAWLGPLTPDIDALLKAGEALCRADTITCESYFSNYVNFKRGYPPLANNAVFSARAAAHGCNLGAHDVCAQVTHSHLTAISSAKDVPRDAQFLDAFARSAAQRASDLGRPNGTLWLLTLAAVRPDLGAKSRDQLKASICPNQPDACKAAEEARSSH